MHSGLDHWKVGRKIPLSLIGQRKYSESSSGRDWQDKTDITLEFAVDPLCFLDVPIPEIKDWPKLPTSGVTCIWKNIKD